MSSYSSLYKGGTPPNAGGSGSGVLTPTAAKRQASFKQHGSNIVMGTLNTPQQPQQQQLNAGHQQQQPPANGLVSQPSYGALPSGYPTYTGYNPTAGSTGTYPYQPTLINAHSSMNPQLMHTQNLHNPHHPMNLHGGPAGGYPMYPTYSPYGPPPPNPYAPVQGSANPYLAGGVLPPHPQAMGQHHPMQHAASAASLPRNPAAFVQARPVSNPGTALASPSQTQPNSHRRSHTTASTKSAKGERSAQPSPPRGSEEEVKAVRVRVIARVRPMLPHEQNSDRNSGQCVGFPALKTLQITLPVASTTITSPTSGSRSIMGSPNNGAGRQLLNSAGVPIDGEENQPPPTTLSRRFEFDAVLDPSASQVQVFEQSGVKEYCDAALQGYAATVFAYGQTGSGSVTDTKMAFSMRLVVGR